MNYYQEQSLLRRVDALERSLDLVATLAGAVLRGQKVRGPAYDGEYRPLDRVAEGEVVGVDKLRLLVREPLASPVYVYLEEAELVK